MGIRGLLEQQQQQKQQQQQQPGQGPRKIP
jgi:hypothetical protein